MQHNALFMATKALKKAVFYILRSAFCLTASTKNILSETHFSADDASSKRAILHMLSQSFEFSAD